MPEVTPGEPLHELLSRSMVDIYVGPENTHWILHEKLLCHHSPFFRQAFSEKDSNSKSFELPEEEDGPFKTLIGWLYSTSLPVPREEADLGVLFDLYLLSEKLQIQNLIADVLQVVREWYKYSDTYPALRRVQYIYANTEEGDPMRHMLVHSVARLMVLEKGIPQHWEKAFKKNGQLAVDVIKAIQDWRLDEEVVPDARDDPAEAEELIDVDEDLEDNAEADDSEDTVIDSPVDIKHLEKDLKQKPVGGNIKDFKKKGDDLTGGFKKLGLQEIPNGIVNGDYGTLH